jgi:hypothetical protein
MSATPHSILGIGTDATASEIRAARRDLARVYHPDAGGDAAIMQRINAAAAQALRLLGDAEANGSGCGDSQGPPAGESSDTTTSASTDWVGTTRDVPSFTIEALPAEAFEALLVATAELGEVEDDDPPYQLRTLLAAPLACWCQLDVVPDAGASTVSVSIAAVDGCRPPPLVDVRNAYITALNGLDWSSL